MTYGIFVAACAQLLLSSAWYVPVSIGVGQAHHSTYYSPVLGVGGYWGVCSIRTEPPLRRGTSAVCVRQVHTTV